MEEVFTTTEYDGVKLEPLRPIMPRSPSPDEHMWDAARAECAAMESDRVRAQLDRILETMNGLMKPYDASSAAACAERAASATRVVVRMLALWCTNAVLDKREVSLSEFVDKMRSERWAEPLGLTRLLRE